MIIQVDDNRLKSIVQILQAAKSALLSKQFVVTMTGLNTATDILAEIENGKEKASAIGSGS